MRYRYLAPALAFIIPLSGCSSDDGPASEPISKTVTPSDGGEINSSDGLVHVFVPGGAVDEEVTITVKPATDYPRDDRVVEGSVYEFGPDGLVFKKPVQIDLGYDGSRLNGAYDQATLAIQKVVSGEWAEVPGSFVNTNERFARAEVMSFSVYGVRFAGTDANMDPVGNWVLTFNCSHLSGAQTRQARFDAISGNPDVQYTMSFTDPDCGPLVFDMRLPMANTLVFNAMYTCNQTTITEQGTLTFDPRWQMLTFDSSFTTTTTGTGTCSGNGTRSE